MQRQPFRPTRQHRLSRSETCCKPGVSINPAGTVSPAVRDVTAPHPGTSEASGGFLVPEPTI